MRSSTRRASRPPSRGPAPRETPLRLAKAHEVPDDQEVVGEAHLADRLQLEREPVAQGLVDRTP